MKILYLIFIILVLKVSAQKPIDTDGNGYRNISTLEQLRWVSENDSSWSWSFELDNDIDAIDTRNWNEGKGFSPIGNMSTSFMGDFNGNNYVIDNLYVSRNSANYVGFIGVIGRGNVDTYNESSLINLGLTNSHISGNDYVGGLVGCSLNSNIIKCFNSGEVAGRQLVGGIVGCNIRSLIANSFSFGKVQGEEEVGGVTGTNSFSLIIQSYSKSDVEGKHDIAGGLVGMNHSSNINSCYSIGSVTGKLKNIGGLVGIGDTNEVSNCFWNIETSEQLSSSGGTGKSSKELKEKSTYKGWNFDFIWEIKGNYPIIKIDFTYRPKDTDNDGFLNISTLNDLRWLSESWYDLDSNFELDNNINAGNTKYWNGGLGFSPIGFLSKKYQAEFKGNGFFIDSLQIFRETQDFVGFFGYIAGATIMNFGLANCSIKGGRFTGGIAGQMYASTIKNSFTTGNVNATSSYVGGIAGFQRFYATISNCFSRANVNGVGNIGGVVGSSEGTSIINNSYSTGKVEGERWVGAFCGICSAENCFWDMETSGAKYSSSGIAKSSEELKTKSTFTDVGWDFENIWTIDGITNDGYPYFRDIPTVILENEIILDKNIIVYPNPAEDYIEILISNNRMVNHAVESNEIEIYDVRGNLVINSSTPSLLRNATPQEGNFKIDISHLPRGVYFVRIGDRFEKFVKM